MRNSVCSLVMVILPLLTACRDSSVTGCTRELIVALHPRDTTITVGESFTASVGLATCGGRFAVSDTFVWRAQDSLIVAVDSAIGRITGRSPGETWVEVIGNDVGAVDACHVVVSPAGR